MKKNYLAFITLIALSPLCLSSCNANANNPPIYQTDVKEMINVDTDDLDKILDSTMTSLIFVGSIGCASCEQIKTYVNSYIQSFSTNVYHYDISANLDYQNLFNKYPKVFVSQSWPQILVTKEAETLKTIDLKRISNETQFFSELNGIIKRSKTINIRSTSTINTMLSQSEYFFYIFDIEYKEIYQKYTNLLFEKVENNSIMSGVINSTFFSEGKELIKSTLSITYENFAVIKKNGNYKVAEYSDEISMKEIANLL